MQKRYDYCPNCMQGTEDNVNICRGCGFDLIGYEEKEHLIKPCTMLKDKYMIGKVIGEGGFGVTYKGWDMVLQTFVAIKEYFPQFLAHRSVDNTQIVPTTGQKETYEKGLKRYLEEAQNLSKFYQLSGIVSVKDFFYENGTGYIVMEYIDGVDLKQYLNDNGGKLPEAKVRTLMKPVFESLMEVHETGLIHRDISPDNIMVDKKNRIKLIDFGSVRNQSTMDEKTYTVMLKHGYAPPEQYYAKGKQGPWTDIYSICAAMYKMLTGNTPPNSIERMTKDEYVSPSYYGVNVSPKMEYVLRKGLSVNYEERYQSIKPLMDELYFGKAVANNPQQPIMGQPVASQGVMGQPGVSQAVMRQQVAQQPMASQVGIGQQMPGRMYNPQNVPAHSGTPYLNNRIQNQQVPQQKKSKVWIPIVVGILLLSIVVALVVPSFVDSKKSKNRKTTTEEKTVDDDIVIDDGGVTTDNPVKYYKYGVTVTLPSGYEYDEVSSDSEFYFYDNELGSIFMMFGGYTNGATEEVLIESVEQTLSESYNLSDWAKTETEYNGISCTEFSGTVEESGVKFKTTAAVCYLNDVYFVLMYMPIDGEYADYYDAMNTITND